MAEGRDCDVAIVGGGLAGGLIALALARQRPELAVLLIEAGDTFGGNHLWSFFDSDVAVADRWLVDPLICHRWEGHDVLFPRFCRHIGGAYQAITSERLDAVLREALPPERLRTGCKVLAASSTAVILAEGGRIDARGVIDARGPGNLAQLELGWQKFLGRELVLSRPHGLRWPIVMDATVEQIDGYRFVYCLPFAEDRLFVEDTYYSDTRGLDAGRLGSRIEAFAAARGWSIEGVGREEAGALPVLLGGDFEAYWRSGGNGVAKAGVRAGLFHPTTGYSLPDAVRTASFVAALADVSGAALHAALHAYAGAAWQARGFYRLLDRMLFRAAIPDRRRDVLERFYTLDHRLIGRFYAGSSTLVDKMRILSGKPPVPIRRALAVMREDLRA
ncbi:lycopene beta-cyclase CrtY [Flavisphingomonas formosensis]|uniref:lycopene beta-cyclase CrtY n=1 Tax=Flavisphingomonas formosensis TaxID=861534 RepID=UPI0012F9B090|nr:lycopene beta-cyclase CrtY [Sphingomonas formosensis]